MNLRPLLFLALSSLLFACSMGPAFTLHDFEVVEEGSSISSVVETYGRPSDIRFEGDATEEYVYIERRRIATEMSEYIYYILKVKDGVVVDKEMERSEPPPVFRWVGRTR